MIFDVEDGFDGGNEVENQKAKSSLVIRNRKTGIRFEVGTRVRVPEGLLGPCRKEEKFTGLETRCY